MIHLLLFDIDNVLVDARGYRKALRDTVARFSQQMGLGELPPTEEEIRAFEANGLTSEWDSGAACVAALLLERLCREPSLSLPSRWPDVLPFLAAHPCPIDRPDYATFAQKVGESLKERLAPTKAIRTVLWNEIQALPMLRTHWSVLSTLFDALLDRTYDFYFSPVTRVFQHLAIGSQGVAKTYGVPPDFESPAYLECFDRPLLSPVVRQRLKEAVGKGLRAALYTLRPSLPPIEVNGHFLGYSPEAEMARSLVGLEEWPIIGLGRIQWLAQQSGADIKQLLKPFPVQALAAIGAAWSGQEAISLEAALALHRDGELRPPLAELPAATLHAFEDSASGLQAIEYAVQELRMAGVPITWHAYYIRSNVPTRGKPATARPTTYRSVNEAILAALALI